MYNSTAQELKNEIAVEMITNFVYNFKICNDINCVLVSVICRSENPTHKRNDSSVKASYQIISEVVYGFGQLNTLLTTKGVNDLTFHQNFNS